MTKLKLQLITGQFGTELSLTVPITNSLAFLFTVLGEWWADGKVISRGKLHKVPTFTYLPYLPYIHVSAGQEVEVNCETFVRLHDVFAYDESGASCNGGRRLTDLMNLQIRGLEWGLYSAGLPCAFIVKPHRIEKGFIMVSWEDQDSFLLPAFQFYICLVG